MGRRFARGKSRDRPVLIKLHDETGRQSVTSVTRTIFIIIRASISLLRSFSHYLQSLSFSRFNVLSFLINVAANVTFFFFFFPFPFFAHLAQRNTRDKYSNAIEIYVQSCTFRYALRCLFISYWERNWEWKRENNVAWNCLQMSLAVDLCI